MRYRIARAAEQDLTEIFVYWADRASLTVADRIIERIVARFRLLGAHPRAGKTAGEVAAGVGCFPVGKYLIYYRKAPGVVEILHIFHSARDRVTLQKKSKRER